MRCMVIGEDLGTVPDDVRATLRDHGMLSYRVLLFERDASGDFLPPQAYPAAALAVATHARPADARRLVGGPRHPRAGRARAARGGHRRRSGAGGTRARPRAPARGARARASAARRDDGRRGGGTDAVAGAGRRAARVPCPHARGADAGPARGRARARRCTPTCPGRRRSIPTGGASCPAVSTTRTRAPCCIASPCGWRPNDGARTHDGCGAAQALGRARRRAGAAVVRNSARDVPRAAAPRLHVRRRDGAGALSRRARRSATSIARRTCARDPAARMATTSSTMAGSTRKSAAARISTAWSTRWPRTA